MACPDEIQDCDLLKLGDGQLLRKLLRLDGECLKLAVQADVTVEASVEVPVESSVTTDLITSAEAAGSQTLAGLYAAYGVWKAGHSTRKVVREVNVVGGDGIPGIIISHTA